YHEVLGLQQVGVLIAGPGAVVALFALGVEAHPAEPAAQIGLVDAVEAVLGVGVDDAIAHVERVVFLLELLVGVERVPFAERPLPFGAGLARGTGFGLGLRLSHGTGSFGSRLFGPHAFTGGLSGGADPAAS